MLSQDYHTSNKFLGEFRLCFGKIFTVLNSLLFLRLLLPVLHGPAF